MKPVDLPAKMAIVIDLTGETTNTLEIVIEARDFDSAYHRLHGKPFILSVVRSLPIPHDEPTTPITLCFPLPPLTEY